MQPEFRQIFDYLSLRDEPCAADVIVGFGHFDLNIPERCLELYKDGYADRIVFTGGVGAGSAGFTQPEAREFAMHLREIAPGVESDLLLEDRSTNTGENLHFTEELLRATDPAFTFRTGIEKALIVCTPARQRRVFHTCRLMFPNTEFTNCPPETAFADNATLFEKRGQSFREQLLGEVARLISYPGEGLIEEVQIPEHVLEAYFAVK